MPYLLRVELPDVPGSLGRVATAIGMAGGDIEAIPLPDSSVDVVVSNCVINLAPNKEKVFKEIARVLKPGGEMIFTDPMRLRMSLSEGIG